MAHGPTIAIAAVPSSERVAGVLLLRREPLAYIVPQKFATALPAGSLNVDLPSSTSCLPPDSAAYSG